MAKIGDKTVKLITDLIHESLGDAQEDLNLLFLKTDIDDNLKVKIDCLLSVAENNGVGVEVRLKSSIPEKVERSLAGTAYEKQMPLEFSVDGDGEEV